MFIVRRVDREIVEAWDTDNLVLVEERDQTGNFLMVQAPLFDTSEDADIGQDGPCIVRPDGECAYHAVVSYRLTRTSIESQFTPAAAADLDLPERLALVLDVADDDLDRLGTGLGELLPGAIREPA